MEIVNVENSIALFAPHNSFEMFYLCNFVEVEVSKDDIFYGYNHMIKKGMEYLKCNYLEKFKEIRRKVCNRTCFCFAWPGSESYCQSK